MVLLKSVAQAIPSYVMSVFRIPQSICEELERSMNNFWWGRNRANKNDICWTAWESLCERKETRGLGFRKLQQFNQALLAKQAWRLLTNRNSLAARIYKARYYPNKELFDAALGPQPSYIWRSIHGTFLLVCSRSRWRVGMGDDIRVWGDLWVPSKQDPFILTAPYRELVNAKVSSLK